MIRAKLKSAFGAALILALLSLGLAGCETIEDMNPFDQKKAPLSGERRAVFPQGVPGVERSAPPQQPSNSNIQIQQQQQAPEPAPEAEQQPKQKSPQRQTRNQKKATSDAADDDPWAGQRR